MNKNVKKGLIVAGILVVVAIAMYFVSKSFKGKTTELTTVTTGEETASSSDIGTDKV